VVYCERSRIAPRNVRTVTCAPPFPSWTRRGRFRRGTRAGERVVDRAGNGGQVEHAAGVARQQEIHRSVVVGELEQSVGRWCADHADVARDGGEPAAANARRDGAQRAGDRCEVGVRDGTAQGQAAAPRACAHPRHGDVEVDVSIHRFRLDRCRRAGEPDRPRDGIEPTRDVGARDVRASALHRDPARARQVDDELRGMRVA